MNYVAHITIKAATTLKVGGNEIDLIIDMPVLRDWNRLPFIPGTSITGILRKELDKKEADAVFGYEEKHKDEGMGSKVLISNALLVDERGKVHEELMLKTSPFLQIFEELPLRDHTAIDEKGTAKEHHKFDEEVVYKGTKFRFSIESEDEDAFYMVLKLFENPFLRIGGGKTKGFGAFEIEDVSYEEMDLERYASYTASLNEALKNRLDHKTAPSNDWTSYRLEIRPEFTFMFGSGLMDTDADMTYVTEQTVDYDKGGLSEEKVLIPASSIKGALAHRTLFYLNESKGNNSEEGETETDVPSIFGEKSGKEGEGRAGNILLSDCYLERRAEKVFDHVRIDRFTGGAAEGALFQEKCVKTPEFVIDIHLKSVGVQDAVEAFEKALHDIVTGMLPLGGSVMRGHGIFEGTLYKNGEPYEPQRT